MYNKDELRAKLFQYWNEHSYEFWYRLAGAMNEYVKENFVDIKDLKLGEPNVWNG